MKVFLVIIEDRHVDVEVQVFSEKRDAIRVANGIVHLYDYEPEEPDEPVDGWIFHATLSCEGACVRVKEAEVQ